MDTPKRTRPARAQLVTTASGFHGRIVGANGEAMWSTEVLSSKANVRNAFEAIASMFGLTAGAATHMLLEIEEVDE